jgi:hypothetical protein
VLVFYFQVWNADLSRAEFFQCQTFTILTPDLIAHSSSSSTYAGPTPPRSSSSKTRRPSKTQRPSETPETSETSSTTKTAHSTGNPRPPGFHHPDQHGSVQGGLSQGGEIGIVVSVLGGCLLFGLLVWCCGHHVRDFKFLRRCQKGSHEKHRNSNGEFPWCGETIDSDRRANRRI